MKTLKILFGNCGQTPVKILFLSALFLLTAPFSKAQYGTYFDGIHDHIYTTVGTIPLSIPSTFGPGYTTASTALNPTKGISMKGEINRYQGSGLLSWSYQYSVAGAEVRFNHIEVFENISSGQLQYLVVGSIKYASGNDMLVALVDDNGTPLVWNTFSSTAFPHLLGIKGTYLSDGNFAVIGVSSTGFLSTDKRNLNVFKLDPSLNIIQNYAYSSNTFSSPRDFDSPSDVIEGATPNEFFITGASNPGPSILNVLIDMTTGTVIWANQWNTGIKHYSVGADSFYDPASSSIWILSNASASHNMHLIQEDYTTGTVLSHYRFNPGSNAYGYELKRSLFNPNAVVIGGWETSGVAVRPFMLEYDPPLNTVLWTKYYPGADNQMRLYNENDWLKVNASGQFGYYYNRIMGYTTDGTGYVLLSSDTTNAGTEDIRLWRDISSSGNNNCGVVSSPFTTTLFSPPTSLTLDEMSDLITPVSVPLSHAPVIYTNDLCIQGSLRPLTEAAGNTLQLSAAPNPANDQLKIKFPASVTGGSILIYNTVGRKVYEKDINLKSSEETIDVSEWPSGVYIISLKKNGTTLSTEKVVIQK